MIDGKGRFLPESKRALPTPMVSFYKIFGLSRMFPRSKRFARYHLGHLDPDHVHNIEILTGAFMFLRRSAIDKTGLLDEDFFMYGEDIDLSYRLILAGYTNHYFPEATIIHYKGESTKKSSINYVMLFYKAMIVFARKHFSKKRIGLYIGLIQVAIYFRAFLSVMKRLFQKIYLPLLDAGLFMAGFLFIEPFWETFKFGGEGGYPAEYLTIVVPLYIVLWLLAILLTGGYDRPYRVSRQINGIVSGSLFILLVYALLPESLRYSRAIIIFGSLWAIVSLLVTRTLLHWFPYSSFRFHTRRKKRMVIVGSRTESDRVYSLAKQSGITTELLGYLSPGDPIEEKQYLGTLSQLEEVISVNRVNEILFCAKDVPAHQIIKAMNDLTALDVEFKIAPPESIAVIGSNSIDTMGDLYLIQLNAISTPRNSRNKRLFDIFVSGLLLLIYPLIFYLFKRPGVLLVNLLSVFRGKDSMVGFYRGGEIDDSMLPRMRKGILTPMDRYDGKLIEPQIIEQGNLTYAKDYRILNDFRILIKGFRNLDRSIH
jgi:hypothetical protein